jgi:hypothetical protein
LEAAVRCVLGEGKQEFRPESGEEIREKCDSKLI